MQGIFLPPQGWNWQILTLGGFGICEEKTPLAKA